MAAIDDDVRQKYNLPERLDRGVVVTEVEPDSPAASRGLRPGDVLLEVNREPVNTPAEFVERYDDAKKSILVLVYRGGRTQYLVLEK